MIPLSTSATYAYNAQGQRVTRVEDEVITHFYYTGSALLFTTVNEYVLQTQNILDPAGSIVASKRFEGQAATGQEPYADDYFFYRYDIRGSVTNIVDGEGTVVKSYDYDEFGVTTASGDTFFNEVTFTGSVADASGLLYMNARYYNPATARFLSQDSYTGSASVPWTQHLYAYCNNNPVNMVDPTGHWAMRPFTVNINDGGGGSSEQDDNFPPPVSIYTGPGPVSIVLQDTTIKITAYVDIKGDLDKNTIISGIEEYWSGIYQVHASTLNLVTKVIEGESPTGDAIKIRTKQKLGVSHVMWSIFGWKPSRVGSMTLYAGDSRTQQLYDDERLKWVSAHEFGHILGVDDYYTKYPSSERISIFNRFWNSVTGDDIEMVLKAFGRGFPSRWESE